MSRLRGNGEITYGTLLALKKEKMKMLWKADDLFTGPAGRSKHRIRWGGRERWILRFVKSFKRGNK